tara:strand:- start:202 stop:840 length:639 start_codon:yes stop_codon:yes gene_type:complete
MGLLVPDPEFVAKCLFSIFLGGFISFSLIISGQNWAKSFSNVTTFLLLPLIGMVITEVISGNIALSLGMVGALSIVRFRHPVKSPLELSIYFLLITLGITANSSPSKAITLSIFSMFIVYTYGLYVSRKSGLEGFIPNLSSEGRERRYLLEVESTVNNERLVLNKNLLFSHEDRINNRFIYKIDFEFKKELDLFVENLKDETNISSIKIVSI